MKLVFIIIVFLVFLYLLLLMLPQVSKTDKIKALALFIVLIIAASLYEVQRDSSDKKMFMAIEAFKNGETLNCNGVEVNKKNFNFVSGTNTFLGKNDSNYSMQRYQVKDCIE
ncbi:MAG: hypothetical protein ACLFQJ_02120 [Campylobacterales bacterium]